MATCTHLASVRAVSGLLFVVMAAGNALLAQDKPSPDEAAIRKSAASYVQAYNRRDAKAVARWGQLSWRGNLPGGSKVEFQTRSGNSGRADNTWSDWSAAGEWTAGDTGSAAVGSPAARYIRCMFGLPKSMSLTATR